MRWFQVNRRDLPWRKETSPYRILVAEKMLQQTDVGHVLKVYHQFFEKFPDLMSLHCAPIEEIEQTIKPLGFWRIRARDFKNIADYILTDCRGEIPRAIQALDDIPGVGRYVSCAMACFCYNQRQPIVDVNVRRIIHRILYWGEKPPNDSEIELLVQQLIPPGRSKQFNWALLDFSASVCRQNPKCEVCFASSSCKFFLSRKVPLEKAKAR